MIKDISCASGLYDDDEEEKDGDNHSDDDDDGDTDDNHLAAHLPGQGVD